MLLLAFVGVAKAEVVTIGDGTSTTYVTPFNSLWGYSFVEQIFTADEIGTAGTINAISFNMQSTSEQTNQVEVFMKAVSRNSFSGSTDYAPPLLTRSCRITATVPTRIPMTWVRTAATSTPHLTVQTSRLTLLLVVAALATSFM